MTIYYGDYPFKPQFPDRDMIETDKAGYWEGIATQAVEFFQSKDDYMEWVCNHYFLDENRFTADMSWDLVKYVQENPEMDCE